MKEKVYKVEGKITNARQVELSKSVVPSHVTWTVLIMITHWSRT